MYICEVINFTVQLVMYVCTYIHDYYNNILISIPNKAVKFVHTYDINLDRLNFLMITQHNGLYLLNQWIKVMLLLMQMQ